MQPADHQNQEFYRFLAQNGLINVNNNNGSYVGFPGGASCDQFSALQSFCSSSSYNYYPLEGSGVSTEHETSPQDRALAALKNHKEAEKRRRERINSHLDKLRGLLPCNSKVLSVNYNHIYLFFARLILKFVFGFVFESLNFALNNLFCFVLDRFSLHPHSFFSLLTDVWLVRKEKVGKYCWN